MGRRRRKYKYANQSSTPQAQNQPEISQYSRPFPKPQPLQSKEADRQVAPLTQPPTWSLLEILNASPVQTLPIRPKLAIGALGDKYEQEADAVAAQVVQQLNHPQPAPVQRDAPEEEEDNLLQQKPLRAQIQCTEGYEDEEEDDIRMKPLENMMQLRGAYGGGAASPDLERSIQRERGKGQPMAEDVRQPMESAFGVDFGGVRIHTDNTADQLNHSIQAKAFTTGQDVFFRQGAYAPESRAGQGLLAHELTHVVQQCGDAIAGSSPVQTNRGEQIQRKAVQDLSQYQTERGAIFYDLGNGLFGSDRKIVHSEVEELVNCIHQSPDRTNIQILTGTHGDMQGNLTGDPVFYEEDLSLEGHQHDKGGWVTVLDVKHHRKERIESWMKPGSNRAVILAWCFSEWTVKNWPFVNARWGKDEKWAWSEDVGQGATREWAISHIQEDINDRLNDFMNWPEDERLEKLEKIRNKSDKKLLKQLRKMEVSASDFGSYYEEYLKRTDQIAYPLPYPLIGELENHKCNQEEYIQKIMQGRR
ncbi:MAG: DUF4157 domain-containing protein [Cyanobacteria bacterium P01_G01_bin.54]